MDDKTDDTLIVHFLVLLPMLVFFPIGIVVPLVFYGVRLWQSGAPARAGKRQQSLEVSLARENTRVYEIQVGHFERMKRMEIDAEQRKLPPPPPPTREEALDGLHEGLEAELTRINALGVAEDEKVYLRNQAMDAFMARMNELLR